MSAYTARGFAVALDKTKRAILLDLQDVPASDMRTVRGQRAKVWEFSALPTIMRENLEAASRRGNFPNPEAMLDYCAAMDVATPRPSSNPAVELERDLQSTLSEAIGCITDPENPSARDAEYIWGKVCEQLNALNFPHRDMAAAKKSLAAWLQKNVPGLFASVRNIERKLARFKADGAGALADGRTQRSGNFRAILCTACWEKLLTLAIKLGGRESHAWRQMKLKGQLCPECDKRHEFNVRKAKSHVPHSIRDRLTPTADKALDFAKSDSAGRMGGPKMNPTYDHMMAGAWFVADDVTWNHEVWTHDTDGTPRRCRPECLYMADERTSYPIHFILIPGADGQKASYNANHVRLLMLQAHDKLGLPNRGYAFENGVWRARTVRDEQAGGEWMSWAETELGFKNLKHFVEIRHTKARTPTGKPTIEGDFRILQERMRTEPGFVGFNQRQEQSDKSKRLKRDFDKRVRVGKEHPGNEYYSLTEWSERLAEIFLDYANEPQNGKRLPGVSPAEAWGTPVLRKLDDEARWILATRRERLKVTERGLKIKGRSYANGELSRYIGQWVWAFYNLEDPSLLTVCDRKLAHYFSVPELTAPARTAMDTAEGRAALNGSLAQIDDFNRSARIIAGSIKHSRVHNITRDSDAGEEHRAFGRKINADVARHRETQSRVSDARRRRTQEAEQLHRSAMMNLSSDDSTIIAPL